MIYSSQRKGTTMGNITSQDLSDNDYGLSLENSLAIHLQSNHYPPVPLAMVAVCISTIASYNESGGDCDGLIKLPKGVSWRGQDSTTAWTIIENFHLAEWCVSDYDY